LWWGASGRRSPAAAAAVNPAAVSTQASTSSGWLGTITATTKCRGRETISAIAAHRAQALDATWGAMGAARDSYETALRYALERRQFGTPIASFQLTQQKLVDMVLEIQKGVLVALQTGRLKTQGSSGPSRSHSASSTTSARPSRSAGPRARSSAATV
jgi:alkylation response protein AidB-like acyl-CoA dehydrogenase